MINSYIIAQFFCFFRPIGFFLFFFSVEGTNCNNKECLLNIADCLFVVDRFHWANHKACSSGHCADCYSPLRGVNTEAVEQRHALTLKIRKMLSYMKPSNFLIFLKLFNWFLNGKLLGGHAKQYSDHFEEFHKM